jgi:hypothetical protein
MTPVIEGANRPMIGSSHGPEFPTPGEVRLTRSAAQQLLRRDGGEKNRDPYKTILQAAMTLAEHPTVVGRSQVAAQKPRAAIEVTCIV